MLFQKQNFFKPGSSTSSNEVAPLTPSVSAEKQSTIELHLEKSSAAKAKIIWTLKSVMSGYSAHLNQETLAAMFPEFKATKSCLANYGNQNIKLLVLLSYLCGLKVRSHLID